MCERLILFGFRHFPHGVHFLGQQQLQNGVGLIVDFQNIDRKVSLNDIVSAKSLEMNKLLDEIEAIVNSGTKLNLDYYINEVMDQDHQEEVFEYFREAETESISDALDELGEDEYTVEDIRLMRIKFLSEMGL